MNDQKSETAIQQKVIQILAGDTDLLLKESERLGKELAQNDLSKSQIRNIYSTVKRIASGGKFDSQDQHELKLLIPKIQYAIARSKALKSLGDILTLCIKNVGSSKEKFNLFSEFFEAIVAYHYSEHEQRKQEKRF